MSILWSRQLDILCTAFLGQEKFIGSRRSISTRNRRRSKTKVKGEEVKLFPSHQVECCPLDDKTGTQHFLLYEKLGKNYTNTQQQEETNNIKLKCLFYLCSTKSLSSIYYAPPSRPGGPRRCPDRSNAGDALVFSSLSWLLYRGCVYLAGNSPDKLGSIA